MSGDTMQAAPRKHYVPKLRPHDYLYDSSYIVSGARDYARTAFKAAMGSAQLVIQPVYKTMFSELRKYPSMHIVYYPNCRLPDHLDRSYTAYCARVKDLEKVQTPQLLGRDRYKFSSLPKQVLQLKTTSPEFHPPTPTQIPRESGPPKSRGTQSIYRETSAQTLPWQPDGKAAETCENTPEVLYLDKLEWGPGKPYRTGDLPADFHTTEIINKMRHARAWTELAEKGQFPRWMKNRDAIISDIETKDWIFREAEIDELQDIRLSLLHKLQAEKRGRQTSRTSKKLAKLWANKKQEMEHKINIIRRSRDRELRKLTELHESGGRAGLVQRLRAARGMGSVCLAAYDPTSDAHAPVIRHGYQAQTRHADITYDSSLLLYEDHEALAAPPVWLERCGHDLKKTCSGHHIPRNPMQLCERATKWSEDFLANLHNDLKKARLGAGVMSAGPLHVLKPRRLVVTPRPTTPQVDSVSDMDESYHQSALVLQRIIRGRAVQYLMYEGRTRAAELTEELKTTHGLQKEDKIRIAREEAKAREYSAMRTENEQKDDAITALVDELCGGAVSAALDFLEKELRRLKEERRQHAFILIALREKQMREAAEAGRRQKEEHRRREHDEMFKQVLGVTQETVEAYLQGIIEEGTALAAEQEAVRRAEQQADQAEVDMAKYQTMSTAEQNELVAELVQQFLLPDVHRTASKMHIQAMQRAKLDAARKTIFGLLDTAVAQPEFCTQCGTPLGELCRCTVCGLDQTPTRTTSRDDPRWKYSRRREMAPPKTISERYPPHHEFRCMLNELIDDVVVESRKQCKAREEVRYEVAQKLKENLEIELEARDILDFAFDVATGVKILPVKKSKYHHFMYKTRTDAIERTEPVKPKQTCPHVLPSEVRRLAEEAEAAALGRCACKSEEILNKSRVFFDPSDPEQRKKMLPSELRVFEEYKKCKCDVPTPTTASQSGFEFEDLTTTPSNVQTEFTEALLSEVTEVVEEQPDTED